MSWAPIPSQRLVFALSVSKRLDGLFSQSDVHFSQKQSEMWTRLTREHVSTVFRSISDDFGPRELSGISAEEGNINAFLFA